MTPAWGGVVGLIGAYLLGSVPAAYIAGRWARGIDLRTVGSGNLGATNVYREVGAVAGVTVLAVDVMKGLVPAMWFPGLLVAGAPESTRDWWAVGFGVAAIAGHAKPVFLGWRGGGKGVATAAGVFGALAPASLAVAFASFLAVMAATRLVSLSSIVAGVLLPVIQLLLDGATPAMFASLAVAAFVLWAHRTNISRLRAGTEPRFGRPGGRRP